MQNQCQTVWHLVVSYADNKIHQNNEEFSIDDLVKATAIYAKALYELIKE